MESIKCTVNGCSCICYSPVRSQLRICSSCHHGWVAHAMDKIGQRSSSSPSQMTPLSSSQMTPLSSSQMTPLSSSQMTPLSSSQMTTLLPSSVTAPPSPLHNAPLSSSSADPSQANCLFDVASLILFGSEAIPTRLKILLDRLFLHLQRDLVLQVLGSFGWSYDDYCRGYRMQDGSGRVLDKWTMATSAEELIILDQFQRFTETKSIAEEWLLPGQRSGKIPLVHNGHSSPEGHGASSSSPMDVKQILLSGSISRASDVDASRRQFSSGAYLSSLLPRYPSLYNPFLAGPGIPGSVGHLSQASVLPYLLARSPLRALPKPMDFRMESVEFGRGASNPATSQSSPTKRNGKASDMNVGKEETRLKVKMESREERNNSLSSNETNFQSTDEDEPINYSTKEDRVVPDLSKSHSSSSSSSIPIPRNPLIARSPGDQSSTSFPDDEEGRQQSQQQPRKSSSSSVAKKPYQPTPGYGGTLISPNGKKRVLCTACLKTFCDKGALKIHYSAVHLKELHMCTIDGCTMTFSSRRSRNRHSANPNPKLHFGQTGRRRLHNNSGSGGVSSVSSPFKEGQETTLGSCSPPGSPRSAGEGSPNSPTADSEGEFQLCSRSQDGLDRCCNGESNHQPMMGQDEDDEEDRDGYGRGLPPPTYANGDRNEPQEGYNTEGKTLQREDEDTLQEPQRYFHGTTSKRKSAIPTRCSVPPTEDSAFDFHVHDLDPSERKRRRLINDHVVFYCSENNDGGRHELAFEQRMIGNGKAVEGEDGVTAGEEGAIDWRGETLMKSVNNQSIVDLSRPSLTMSQSTDSSETSVEDNTIPIPNGKVFASQVKREAEERDSSSGCCEMSSGSKGIEGFQRHFQAGPVDAGMDFHGGVQRSIHVCKVEGCNASFPSKRSRDRHSANANLHRRLFYSDSIDQPTQWRKEDTTEETGHVVNMTPIDERRKSLDTVLNLTTNATNQMEPNDAQHQPINIDSKVEEKVEISDVQLMEPKTCSSELNEETEGFPDNESTATDSSNRNHSGDTFHEPAKNFCVRKSRNLLTINENLHNHLLLVNSNPVSAQLAV